MGEGAHPLINGSGWGGWNPFLPANASALKSAISPGGQQFRTWPVPEASTTNRMWRPMRFSRTLQRRSGSRMARARSPGCLSP